MSNFRSLCATYKAFCDIVNLSQIVKEASEFVEIYYKYDDYATYHLWELLGHAYRGLCKVEKEKEFFEQSSVNTKKYFGTILKISLWHVYEQNWQTRIRH